MIDFAQVKRDYPVREMAEQLGIRVARRGSRYDLAYCPRHGDTRPSLQLFDDGAHCHGGCTFNGHAFADILDLVKELFGCSTLSEAYMKLTGSLPEPIHRPLPKKVSTYHLSWRDVERGTKNRQAALGYFGAHGIRETTALKHQLGRYQTWRNYVTLRGRQYGFDCGRYSIPDIAFGSVRNIELRLDEADAARRLAALSSLLRDEAMDMVTLAGATHPTEQDLIHFFYGARYLRVPGGIQKNLIFNIERVIQRIEGGWLVRELPYLLVHEGAKKALATEDCCEPDFCYPSVSAKDAAGLAELYNVHELIIVQDNEPDKVKNGKPFNAGKAYAERACAASGRQYGNGLRVVMPPAGFKAADDLVDAGTIHTWMDSLGLEPVRRAWPAP